MESEAASRPWPEQVVALHERRGIWARRLRPRLADCPIRWLESRSAGDLASALEGAHEPIVLADLGRRPEAVLADLASAVPGGGRALVLVLDPGRRAWAHPLAREMGATVVLPGVVTPPEVERLLRRWLALAADRRARLGPARPADPGDPRAWLPTAP
jgi:hypothetical protein